MQTQSPSTILGQLGGSACCISSWFSSLKARGRRHSPCHAFSTAAAAHSGPRLRKAPEPNAQRAAEPSFSFSDLQSHKLGRAPFSFTGDVKKKRANSSKSSQPSHPACQEPPVPMPDRDPGSTQPIWGVPKFLGLAGQLCTRACPITAQMLAGQLSSQQESSGAPEPRRTGAAPKAGTTPELRG